MNRFRIVLLALILPAGLRGQSVLDRTPNLSAGWTGTPYTAFFNFLHRFNHTAAPERQVLNSPTFLMGYSPTNNALLGVHYATRSDIAARYPNEWEFLARYRLLNFAGVQAGYNNAAKSLDGEVSLSRDINRVRVIAAVRAFSKGYGGDSARFALAGGAVLRFSRFLALAGDIATLINKDPAEEIAWGAALQLAIPSTPHTLSLQLTNTTTGTLQGASRGGRRRFGFEFTIPLHMARFRGVGGSTAVPQDSTHVSISQFQFMPPSIKVARGVTVAWKNDDQLAHTVTAVDKSWTSALIQPGAVYTHTFEQAGRYEITCMPHPFMKMTIEVRP